MTNEEPTRQQLIEAQKGVRVYEGIYTVNCDRGPANSKIKWDRRVRYVFDARDDENALDKALNQYPRTIPFLLAPYGKTATLESLSEKRFVSVPGQEPYVWVKEDFGLKELENKVVARA